VRLHYVEIGTGPAVVFLHGNGSSIEEVLASGMVERLVSSHRLIIFDRPGYGYSERPRNRIWTPEAQADLIFEACRELGIYRTTVVGHSWGTLVAVALAASRSSFVRGLVLISGYYFPTPRVDAILFGLPALPFVGDIIRYTVSPILGRLFARQMFKKIFAPQPIPNRFEMAYSTEMALRPWQIRATAEEAALLVPAAVRLRGQYQELNLPVVLFAGSGDAIVDVQRHSVRLHRKVREAELHVLPSGGHMVHHFAAEKAATAVAAFGYL
jgi:pimeloyl-ACP methyl ester carboxylesterase